MKNLRINVKIIAVSRNRHPDKVIVTTQCGSSNKIWQLTERRDSVR